MLLRVLVVGTEFSIGLLLLGWGVATTASPALWRLRGARWWVGWTDRTISRIQGVGVALAGASLTLSAPVPLVPAPVAIVGLDAHLLEVIGLVVVVLGGVLLVASRPTLIEQPAVQEHVAPAHGGITDPVPVDVGQVASVSATP